MNEQYFSTDGRIHLDGPPENVVCTNQLHPDLWSGLEKEFDLFVDLPDGTSKPFKIVPLRSYEEDPDNFIYGEVRARIDDAEEELWELVDPEALLPRQEDELLRVLGNFVANPDEPSEGQKGIRSKKVWLYLGGAALAAGATIAIRGIIVKRRRKE